MKIILYLATSVNGHITSGGDGTDWVTPQTLKDFAKLNALCGVVVMGKRTYEMFGNDFRQESCLNIVMTNDQELLKKQIKGALFTNENPQGIVTIAESKGFEKMFLVGGTKINTSFLKSNLIDEIWINIHPIIIGSGKYLFEESQDIDIKKLELCETDDFGMGQVLLRYKVMK